jgi:hypothetical protein
MLHKIKKCYFAGKYDISYQYGKPQLNGWHSASNLGSGVRLKSQATDGYPDFLIAFLILSNSSFTSARGYNWITLFLGDINTGTWPSRLGESQMSSAGLRPKSHCSGKAQKQLYSKLQTRPLIKEGATK